MSVRMGVRLDHSRDGPVTRRALVALAARQCFADRGRAPFARRDPGAIRPGRAMTHVLVMAAFKLGNPVVRIVLMKANDTPVHRRPASAACMARRMPGEPLGDSGHA